MTHLISLPLFIFGGIGLFIHSSAGFWRPKLPPKASSQSVPAHLLIQCPARIVMKANSSNYCILHPLYTFQERRWREKWEPAALELMNRIRTLLLLGRRNYQLNAAGQETPPPPPRNIWWIKWIEGICTAIGIRPIGGGSVFVARAIIFIVVILPGTIPKPGAKAAAAKAPAAVVVVIDLLENLAPIEKTGRKRQQKQQQQEQN